MDFPTIADVAMLTLCLSLKEERSKNQDFIEDRLGHGPETMHRYLVRLDVHAVKSGGWLLGA